MRNNMRVLHVDEGITYEHKNRKEINNISVADVIYRLVTPFHREQTYFCTRYEHG